MVAIIEDRQVSAAGYTLRFRRPRHGLKSSPSTTEAPLWPNSERAAAPAFISLTSGTTGRPKGIVIDHERMLLRSTLDAERLDGPLLNPLPLSFSASRTHVFSALLQGSGVYFYPMLFSAQQLADTLLAGEATSLCCRPDHRSQPVRACSASDQPRYSPSSRRSIASARQWLRQRRSEPRPRSARISFKSTAPAFAAASARCRAPISTRIPTASAACCRMSSCKS